MARGRPERYGNLREKCVRVARKILLRLAVAGDLRKIVQLLRIGFEVVEFLFTAGQVARSAGQPRQ